MEPRYVNLPDAVYLIENGEVYRLKANKLATVIVALLIVAFIVLFLFDYIKDIIRTFSGYRDILSRKETSGAVKLIGATRGNVIRGIAMVVIVLLILLISAVAPQEKIKLSRAEIPAEVLKAMQA